jgi:hypothetical protein
MAVDQDYRSIPTSLHPLTEDDRVPRCGQYLDLGATSSEKAVPQPDRCTPHIGFVLALGADTRDFQELFEFNQEPIAM